MIERCFVRGVLNVFQCFFSYKSLIDELYAKFSDSVCNSDELGFKEIGSRRRKREIVLVLLFVIGALSSNIYAPTSLETSIISPNIGKFRKWMVLLNTIYKFRKLYKD